MNAILALLATNVPQHPNCQRSVNQDTTLQLVQQVALHALPVISATLNLPQLRQLLLWFHIMFTQHQVDSLQELLALMAITTILEEHHLLVHAHSVVVQDTIALREQLKNSCVRQVTTVAQM